MSNKKYFNASIDVDTYEKLEILSKKEKRSLSNMIDVLICREAYAQGIENDNEEE